MLPQTGQFKLSKLLIVAVRVNTLDEIADTDCSASNLLLHYWFSTVFLAHQKQAYMSSAPGDQACLILSWHTGQK